MDKLRLLLFFISTVFFLFDTNIVAAKASVPDKEFSNSNVKYILNKNQWEEFVKYEAGFMGGKLFLEKNAFTFLFEHPDDMQLVHPHDGPQIEKIRMHAIKVIPVNASPDPIIIAAEPEPYFNNYFIGNDSSKWASDVPLYRKLVYKELYRGIDMKFYSNFNDIKYDFIVSPGADVSKIQLEYKGVEDLKLINGELQLRLSVGDVVIEKPFAYQIINGKEIEVKCHFVLNGHILGFEFPEGFNSKEKLIIDPTLVFSSYTGSSADNWGFSATYDAAGNLYTGGNVASFGFPTTLGAYQVTFGGGGFGGNGWSCDMAIAKFNSSGSTLLYATYLGGSDNEQPHSLVVDPLDNLVIFGTVYSSNYPTTVNAFSRNLSGSGDMVISKLSPTGNTLLASTFVGGNLDDGLNTDPGFSTTGPLKYNYGDEARGEIISDVNSEYIIGSCTKSTNFPVTPGCLQSNKAGGNQDGVVFKINTNLSALVWSTYLGGGAEDAVYDVVIDQNNDLFIAGGTNSANFPTTGGVLHSTYNGGVADGFVTRLNSSGSSILASTFIGTAAYDQTFFVELDYSGDVYITGQTQGSYLVTPGVYSNPNSSQFIHKINPTLNATIYSTVFGNGSNVPNISPTAFLVDTCQNVYVAGWGRCLTQGAFVRGDVTNMPLTPDALQSNTDGCDFYFFVLNSTATAPAYASYFGGGQSQEHVDGGTSRFDKNGVIYEAVCAGCGGSNDFPTTPGSVSRTNNSGNCNNGVIKMAFNLAKTVSSITTSPSSGCAPFTLTFVNSSVNATSYLWDFGDGTATTTLHTPTHTYPNPGVYEVMLIAYNNSSCNHNDTSYAQITVTTGTPPLASFSLNSVAVCDSLTISASANGVNGLVYDWNFGDNTTSTGQNAGHTYFNPGTYQVSLIVRDTVCILAADTITQTVQLLPPVMASVNSIGPFSGCSPLAVSFNSNQTSPVRYWNFMDGSPLDTTLNPSHIFSNSGSYDISLIVIDPNTCNISDTAIISVTVAPAIVLIPSFILNPSTDCISNTVQTISNGIGGQIYNWNFGDGSSTSGTTAFHQYQNTGTYAVTLFVTDTTCWQTDSITQNVTYNPPIVAAATAVNTGNGCIPVTVNYNSAGSSPGKYFWDFNDGSSIDTSTNPTHVFYVPGNYNVQFILEDLASCNRRDTVILPVAINPSMTLDPNFVSIPSAACDTYDLQLSCNPFGGTAIKWDLGDGTDTSAASFVHHYDSAGEYYVTLTVYDTLCALNESSTQTVIFKPTTLAAVDIGGLQFGCSPQTVQLKNGRASGGTYHWELGDGSSSTESELVHTYAEPGKYRIQLVMTDFLSCNLWDEDTFLLIVYPSPTASFISTLTDHYFYSDIELRNRSTRASTYLWNLDDGFTSTDTVVQHRFEHGGDYNVCLYATSRDGCVDTSCTVFRIDNAETIFVPNAFTPNGDGNNDFFRVESYGILEMQVYIFNRWGDLIHEYTTPEGHWDGRTNNIPAPADVYVYKIIAKGLVHPNTELIGKVTLVR